MSNSNFFRSFEDMVEIARLGFSAVYNQYDGGWSNVEINETTYDSDGVEDVLFNDKQINECASMEEIKEEKHMLQTVQHVAETCERVNNGFKAINAQTQVLASYVVPGNELMENYRKLYENWNVVLETPRFKNLSSQARSSAWGQYKAALAKFKRELAENEANCIREKAKLNKYWEVVNTLQAWLKGVDSKVWAIYYASKDAESPTLYWTVTGDIQEGNIEIKDNLTIWDEYAMSHIKEEEMNEYRASKPCESISTPVDSEELESLQGLYEFLGI